MNNDDMKVTLGNQVSDPCIMVILGAAGDLAKRKLIPALFHLHLSGFLPDNFAMIGVARRAWTEEVFRENLISDARQLTAHGKNNTSAWQWMRERLYFVEGEFESEQIFKDLSKKITEINTLHHTNNNVLFYYATLPTYFELLTQKLAEAGLLEEVSSNWRRVIVEKPFGRDYTSAVALNESLAKYMQERQIYRIDHYLGKETVQNLLAFRFSNAIFEPIWNQRYVDHVAITVSEDLGIEQRGQFYERTGALRDMVGNHILQLLALIAMEPPISFDPDAVRDEKVKVLKALHVMTHEEVLQNTVRGQYGPGIVDNQKVAGYRQEHRVEPDSDRETYVALKLHIDNWRFAGVPFYVRTGKRLKRRITQIAIQFKKPPFTLFSQTGVSHLDPNYLFINIYPEEGIDLYFSAKGPGPGLRLGDVHMNFNYTDHFNYEPNTGYETLLYDCMIGDATQFLRADSVEACWKTMTPILDVWESLPPRDFPNYAAGSRGPKAADELLAKDGKKWHSAL